MTTTSCNRVDASRRAAQMLYLPRKRGLVGDEGHATCETRTHDCSTAELIPTSGSVESAMLGLYLSDCSSGFDQEFADEWGNGVLSSLLEPGTYYLSVEPFRGDLLTSFTLHVEYVNDRNR